MIEMGEFECQIKRIGLSSVQMSNKNHGDHAGRCLLQVTMIKIKTGDPEAPSQQSSNRGKLKTKTSNAFHNTRSPWETCPFTLTFLVYCLCLITIVVVSVPTHPAESENLSVVGCSRSQNT